MMYYLVKEPQDDKQEKNEKRVEHSIKLCFSGWIDENNVSFVFFYNRWDRTSCC